MENYISVFLPYLIELDENDDPYHICSIINRLFTERIQIYNESEIYNMLYAKEKRICDKYTLLDNWFILYNKKPSRKSINEIVRQGLIDSVCVYEEEED